MYNTLFLKNLSFDDLKLLTAEDLLRPETIARLSEMTDDSQLVNEPGSAREFYENLNDLLAKYQAEVERNPTANEGLNKVIRKISWQALPSQNQKYKTQMLNEGVVSALSLGMDVKGILQKQLASYEYASLPDKQQRKDMSYALENNQESLGHLPIIGEGNQSVKPTVQNWLKSYNLAQPLTSERGKFNQINYLKQNKDVQALSPQEKEILTKVLEIYDWLLFPPPPSQVIEAATAGPEDVEAESKEPLTQEVQEAAEVEKTSEIVEQEIKQPPVVPQRNIPEGFLGEIQPVVDIKPPVVPTKPAARPLKETVPNIAAMAENLPPRSINIQDILSKKQTVEDHQAGIKIGDGEAGGEMKYEARSKNQGEQAAAQEAQANNKAEDIDKKLEELKKKLK